MSEILCNYPVCSVSILAIFLIMIISAFIQKEFPVFFGFFIISLVFLYLGFGSYYRVGIDYDYFPETKRIEDTKGLHKPVYDGVPFKDEEQYKIFLTETLPKEPISRYFVWIFSLPPNMGIFLLSFSFGVLGGVLRVQRDYYFFKPSTEKPTPTLPALPMIFFPIFTGLFSLAPATSIFLLPNLLFIPPNYPRPDAILLVSLICGFAIEETIDGVKKILGKLTA